MVRVLPGELPEVQCAGAIPHKAKPELLREFGIKIADFGGGDVQRPHEAVAPRQVYRAKYKRLVHREKELPVAHDSALVAERLREGLSQYDADIFRGVVVVYFRVAVAGQGQVEIAVAREQFQHVIQKSATCLDVAFSGAVQIQRQRDLRLSGVPRDIRSSHLHALQQFAQTVYENLHLFPRTNADT